MNFYLAVWFVLGALAVVGNDYRVLWLAAGATAVGWLAGDSGRGYRWLTSLLMGFGILVMLYGLGVI